ncbi:D-amino-acid transaminase [Calorimonas adulescens]|uniref:D-alanine aminotransferase n=2 Tax=Calorimonas adulescens TaxID=2606906 RepID=A0A5D8QC02_9THEO|nr:D-amino-acid transaminase [Calorimonas adulescens]
MMLEKIHGGVVMALLYYLDGEILEEEPKVSAQDRGYNFGDGVYEVIRSYRGKLFALEDHVERLFRSASYIDLKLPYSPDEMSKLITDFYNKSGNPEAAVYLQITRGAAVRNHTYERGMKPVVFMYSKPLDDKPLSYYEGGFKAITVHDGRWDMCQAKTICLLYNILAKQKAKDAGCDEAIFVRDNGEVTECGSSNLFIIKDGILKTHPADNRILSGITRKYVIEVARKNGVHFRNEIFYKEDLFTADEVFMTGTLSEISPFVEIDGKTVGNGKPGEITLKLLHSFYEMVRSV